MPVITILSPEGDRFRSRLACALAVERTRADRRVTLVDLDAREKACVRWGSLRMQRDIFPWIPVERHLGASTLVREIARQDDLIVDCPGTPSIPLDVLGRLSDRVILSSGPYIDEIRESLDRVRGLIAAGVSRERLSIVLVGPSCHVEFLEARERFESAGLHVVGAWIPQEGSYPEAHDHGYAMTEVGVRSLREKALELVGILAEEMDTPPVAGREEPRLLPAVTRRAA